MRKFYLVFVNFFASMLFLNAQSWTTGTNVLYTNPSTTKIGVGITAPSELFHINGGALKTGNSVSAADRAINMIKIGDGSNIQIGEWEADNTLSFKANKYNFTGGKVGIGTTAPTAILEVFASTIPNLIIKNSANTRLEMGIPSANGDFASYSKAGDVVIRTLGNDHHGILLHLPNINNDGRSYIRMGDEKNGGWFSLYNNRILTIDGKVGIGIASPLSRLHISGDIRLSGSGSEGNPLILHNTSKTQAGQAMEWKIFNMTGAYGNSLQFCAYDYIGCTTGGMCANRFTIMDNGNVGIGTISPTAKLEVNGVIRTKEVKIETANWSDFVFKKDYLLPSLQSVSEHIESHGHLPDIPSEQEVMENGVNMGEMQVKLLQKIEELTLYVIEQNRTIEILKKEIDALKVIK
ncbi:MAG: hypothetical protein LBH32_06115 [Dysgonamonadaceae bacterium]|jgi:hypothetical protein|nr:hypothetical protein [Dysgonamonadaceae bacterium]